MLSLPPLPPTTLAAADDDDTMYVLSHYRDHHRHRLARRCLRILGY
jgi:hypothetical protein